MVDLNYILHLNAINILEEAEILANQPARRFHPFIDPFDHYSDQQFVKLYRLTKPLAYNLIEMLEPHLLPPSRKSAVSIPRKVNKYKICNINFIRVYFLGVNSSQIFC